MKKKIIILFLVGLTFILGGCKNNEFVTSASYDESFIPEMDFDYRNYYIMATTNVVSTTDDGIYFIEGNYIFYTDLSTMETVPLCNKVDCLHYNETDLEKVLYCDAYVEGWNPFLTIFDEKLYTICANRYNGDSYLAEMNIDGSNRVNIGDMSSIFLRETYKFAHRGVIYFYGNQYSVNGIRKYGISAISLVDRNKSLVQVYEGKYEDGWIQNPIAYGNHIFFSEYHYEGDSFIGSIIMYDIRTGESKEIIKNAQIKGIDEGELLCRNTEGYYYSYNPETDEYLKCDGMYNEFIDNHPTWQCHISPIGDYSLLTAYDLDINDVNESLIILDNNGRIVSQITGMMAGWSPRYMFSYKEEDYIFVYSNLSEQYGIKIAIYKFNDLVNGIERPTFLLTDDNLGKYSLGYIINNANN